MNDPISDQIERMKAECFSLSQKEKGSKGRLLVGTIKSGLMSEGFSEKEADRLLFDLVSLGVSADRFAANEEYDLFASIFGNGYSYMDFFNLTDGGASDSFMEKVDYMVDHCNETLKRRCCEFLFLFLSSDYTFKKEEDRVIRLLLKDS